MSAPDLRTPGERALQEVRAARAMLRLASGRQQSLEAILGNVNTIQDQQPALAASLLVREALRMAPHRRLVLLNVSRQLIQEHGLGPDVDREEAKLAADHIDGLIEESKGAIERREKWIERGMKAALVIALLMVASALAAILYVALFKGSTEPQPPADKESAGAVSKPSETEKAEGTKTK